MNPAQATSSVFSQYFVFEGRARRSEYWWFILLNVIAGFLFLAIFPPLYFIYALGTIIPSLAVMVRRLHDTGRSGWWFFFGFVPFLGPIVLLIFMVMDSEFGQNQYSPDPKRAGLENAPETAPGSGGGQRACASCGHVMGQGANFCRSCGATA
ncbi:MAG: DUF805 domain-containing protein [SAR202 cluster bacterium]|nr:DUF805 domain-containing protein [SAR202 cluster bacterium]